MAAGLKEISLPHETIPTHMFGNVNLQNAMMYVNENFASLKGKVNEAVAEIANAPSQFAAIDHDHDEKYAALKHVHGMDDVTGLRSALDGKAALDHTHNEFLRELPSHYHSTDDVQGLGEALASKADIKHTHGVMDVDGLATELGVKASTAYVDGRVSAVGQTIEPIVKRLISGTDLTPPFVRGANHAGDAFHPSSLTPSVSVDVPGQMQATWERGATGRGVKMNVLTSLFMNGTMFYGAFAELSFDENGCLCKVETAKYWSRVQ